MLGINMKAIRQAAVITENFRKQYETVIQMQKEAIEEKMSLGHSYAELQKFIEAWELNKRIYEEFFRDSQNNAFSMIR